MREKVGKSRNTVFFPMICGSVGSLKRRVQSHLARWEMQKCTPLWREAHVQVKKLKTPRRTTLGSWDVEKVHAVVARSTFRTRNVQNTSASDRFWTFRCRSAWQAQGVVDLTKVSKTWGFCSISKNDGRRGIFEEDLRRCIFRGRRSTRDIFIRAVRRSGRWFPEMDCILEHQIFRFAEMILRDRCSTSYDLASLFRCRRSNLDRWTVKNRKTHWYEAVSSALNFPFLKKVSQKSFVFDVVNFKKWGSLADLFRFWCCQVQKLRKSLRIAVFLMLSSSQAEEVLQKSFVFKLADR